MTSALKIFFIISISSTLISCKSEPPEDTSYSSRIYTNVFDTSFSESLSDGFEVNNSEVSELYVLETPRLWQKGTLENGEPYIELLPDKRNEQLDARGQLMSYGLMEFTDLSDYQRISITADIDLEQIGLGYQDSDKGCDVKAYSKAYFKNTTVANLYSFCIGDAIYGDQLNTQIYNMGEDSALVEWELDFASFQKGMLGYTDSSLPASNIVVKGIKYDKPLYAETFELSSFKTDSALCPMLSTLDGTVTIDDSGSLITGSLATDSESYFISGSKSTDNVFTMNVTLASSLNSLKASAYYGDYTSLTLEIADSNCEALIAFKRKGELSATIESEEVIYSSRNSDAYVDPIKDFEFVPYSDPIHIENVGLNLTPDTLQVADRRMVSNIVSPIIHKNDNDFILIDFSFITEPNELDSSVSVVFAVNYGDGWVDIKRSHTIYNERTSQFTTTLLYSPDSPTMQFSASVRPASRSPIEEDMNVILTDIAVDNVKMVRLDENDRSFLTFYLEEILDFDTCSTSALANFKFIIDFEDKKLIGYQFDDISSEYHLKSDLEWIFDSNLNFEESFLLNGYEFHVKGNLNTPYVVSSVNNCYAYTRADIVRSEQIF